MLKANSSTRVQYMPGALGTTKIITTVAIAGVLVQPASDLRQSLVCNLHCHCRVSYSIFLTRRIVEERVIAVRVLGTTSRRFHTYWAFMIPASTAASARSMSGSL